MEIEGSGARLLRDVDDDKELEEYSTYSGSPLGAYAYGTA